MSLYYSSIHCDLSDLSCKLLGFLVTQSVHFRYPRSCIRSNTAVNLMCQADSSERFFPNSKALRKAMDQFDQSTRTCSHNSKHGQTGGRIRYVCVKVCCFKVIFSKERENNGKQSCGDQFSVFKNMSIKFGSFSDMHCLWGNVETTH